MARSRSCRCQQCTERRDVREDADDHCASRSARGRSLAERWPMSPLAPREDVPWQSDGQCRLSLRERTFLGGAMAIVASRSARGRSLAERWPMSPLAPREDVPWRSDGQCRLSLRERTFVRGAMTIVASRSARGRSFAERRPMSPLAPREDVRSLSDDHCRLSLREKKTFLPGAMANVASRSARGRSLAKR